MKALVVVAHPDDETIFFGGYLLKHSHWDWTIVSVTHSEGTERGDEFLHACRAYRARGILLGYMDGLTVSIDSDRLRSELARIGHDGFELVFTHNSRGEYGHSQHQQVHEVVKGLFPNCYCFGYNVLCDIDVQLNSFEFMKKRQILSECYPSQLKKWAIQLFDLSKEKILSPGYMASSVESEFLGRSDLWSYESSSYESERHSKIVEAVKCAKVRKLLEVGCYEGLLTQKLAEICQVTALDRSEVAVERARARVPGVEFIHCDIEKLGLELGPNDELIRRLAAGEFDAVLCAEVLYYATDYRSVIRKLIGGPKWLLAQHASKFHSRVEDAVQKAGMTVVSSARDNTFGIGIYAVGICTTNVVPRPSLL